MCSKPSIHLVHGIAGGAHMIPRRIICVTASISICSVDRPHVHVCTSESSGLVALADFPWRCEPLMRATLWDTNCMLLGIRRVMFLLVLFVVSAPGGYEVKRLPRSRGQEVASAVRCNSNQALVTIYTLAPRSHSSHSIRNQQHLASCNCDGIAHVDANEPRSDHRRSSLASVAT